MSLGTEEEAVVEETPTVEQPENTVEAGDAPQGEESYDANETTRDTVARILKEQRAKEGDGSQGKEGQEKAQGKTAQDPNLKNELPEDFDPELLAPERFSSRAKAAFQNCPKGVRREINKAIRDVEAGGTRMVQEAQRMLQENQAIHETVRPFAPSWAEKGFSIPAGIASLCAAQEKLTNPQTSLQAYLELGADLGHLNYLPQEIQQYAQQIQQQQPQNISEHPEIRALRENQQALVSYIEQQQIEPVVGEMEAVRQEIDPASGQYKYPELHDEAYLLSLKTRVSEFVGHDPNLSYGDALRKAADERRQNWFGYSNQSNQARLPTANNQVKQRAVNAAVSVRGKIGSPSLGVNPGDPPADALQNPRATAAWAFEQLKNGRA